MKREQQKKSETQKNYYTMRDLTEMFQVCRSTIDRQIALKTFPQPMRIGNRMRWPVDVIDEFKAKKETACRDYTFCTTC